MSFDIRYTGNGTDVHSVIIADSLDSAFIQLFGQSYKTYHMIDMCIVNSEILFELRVVTHVAVVDVNLKFRIRSDKND